MRKHMMSLLLQFDSLNVMTAIAFIFLEMIWNNSSLWLNAVPPCEPSLSLAITYPGGSMTSVVSTAAMNWCTRVYDMLTWSRLGNE